MLLVGSATIFSAVRGFRRKEAIYEADVSAMGTLLGRFICLEGRRRREQGRVLLSILHQERAPRVPFLLRVGGSSHLLKDSAGQRAAGCSTRQKLGALVLAARSGGLSDSRPGPALHSPTLSFHLSNQFRLTAL